MTDNIIPFPKGKIVTENAAQQAQFIAQMQEKVKIKFADTLAQDIANDVLQDLSMSGLELKDEVFTKDFVFMMTVLRSLIYRMMEMEHPLHEFIESNVNTSIEMAETDSTH